MPLTLTPTMLENLSKNGDGVTALLARHLAAAGNEVVFTDDDLATLSENHTDALGELLRDITFAGEHGCYSTFAVTAGWERITPEDLPVAMLYELMGDGASEITDVNRPMAYFNSDLGLIVAWYWDGDGTLIFHSPDLFTLTNSDCKCCYGWESVDLEAELKKRWNYAEIVAAM